MALEILGAGLETSTQHTQSKLGKTKSGFGVMLKYGRMLSMNVKNQQNLKYLKQY